jgi:hypothetical protein
MAARQRGERGPDTSSLRGESLGPPWAQGAGTERQRHFVLVALAIVVIGGALFYGTGRYKSVDAPHAAELRAESADRPAASSEVNPANPSPLVAPLVVLDVSDPARRPNAPGTAHAPAPAVQRLVLAAHVQPKRRAVAPTKATTSHLAHRLPVAASRTTWSTRSISSNPSKPASRRPSVKARVEYED